jgi:cell division protein FtsI (penicillin-binding protein 3)
VAITKKSILTKFYFVAAFMSLFLFAIIFRVFNIQYTQGEKYRKLSADLTVRKIVVEANKGNVYAADGNLLATSMSRFDIYMDVMTVKKEDFDKNVVGLSNSLSKMFGFSSNYYQQKLLNARNRKSRYLSIAKKVGYNNYLEMRKFPIFNLGVYKGGFIAEQETVRAHPIGKIAERTIGYYDARGEAGIEVAYADFM